MTHITAEILVPGFHIFNSDVLYTFRASVCRYTDMSESELLHERLFTVIPGGQLIIKC